MPVFKTGHDELSQVLLFAPGPLVIRIFVRPFVILLCFQALLYAGLRVNTIPGLRLLAKRSISTGFRLKRRHEWPSLISRMRRLPGTIRDPPHTQQNPTKNIPSVTCGMPQTRGNNPTCAAGCYLEATSCEKSQNREQREEKQYWGHLADLGFFHSGAE